MHVTNTPIVSLSLSQMGMNYLFLFLVNFCFSLSTKKISICFSLGVVVIIENCGNFGVDKIGLVVICAHFS